MSDKREEARTALTTPWWPDAHALALGAILETLDDIIARLEALEKKPKDKVH